MIVYCGGIEPDTSAPPESEVRSLTEFRTQIIKKGVSLVRVVFHDGHREGLMVTDLTRRKLEGA